jgi:phosphatidylinositol glycan class B
LKFSVNQIVFFGFIFHVLAAIFSIGHHHCDELFQVYEFAGYKLGLNSLSELPWEFDARMRSGIQPFLVYCFTIAGRGVGITNPFYLAFIVRLLQACLAFWVVYQFLRQVSAKYFSPHAKIILWFMAMLYWCMPYFHARFSSENFSTVLFLMGLTWLLQYQKEESIWHSVLAGFFMGLAFCVRFQQVFFVFGIVAWLVFVEHSKWRYLIQVFFGFLLAMGLGLLSDYWLYGEMVFTWWNYVAQNVFENKASHFGTSPVYFYVTESILQLIPPFSLVLVWTFLFYFYKNPKSVFTWMCVPFIVLHTFVPHKELRFLFPLLYFLPVIVEWYVRYASHENTRLQKILVSKAFRSAFLSINFLALVVFTVKPADDETVVYQKLYDIGKHKPATLFYEERNPYNAQAGLHYFRHPDLHCLDISTLGKYQDSSAVYFFHDGFSKKDILIKHGKVFIRQYSNFPDWISYLDFNGWLSRANAFSIYRMYQ